MVRVVKIDNLSDKVVKFDNLTEKVLELDPNVVYGQSTPLAPVGLEGHNPEIGANRTFGQISVSTLTLAKFNPAILIERRFDQNALATLTLTKFNPASIGLGRVFGQSNSATLTLTGRKFHNSAPLSCVTLYGDASATTFAFPFSVLSANHVGVTLDGVTQAQGTNNDFIISGATVVLAVAPGTGVVVIICRATPHPERWIKFTQGAAVRDPDATEAFTQCLHYAEEVEDLVRA